MIYDQYLIHLYEHTGPVDQCPKCPPPPPPDPPWPLVDQITLGPVK